MWLLPLIALVVASALIRWTSADLLVSQLYFGGRYRHWAGLEVDFFQFLYKYGQFPAIALGVSALLASLSSLSSRVRLQCFFVFAAIVLGPAVMINGVLKPNFCRPRPAMTLEFGGRHGFLAIGQVGVPDIDASSPSGMSFPSGHAAMGFALMVPAFVLFRRRRAWAVWFLALGLVSGTFLGFVRIAQGAHFFSDVLWSLGTVYFSSLFVGLTLDVVLHRLARTRDVPPTTAEKGPLELRRRPASVAPRLREVA